MPTIELPPPDVGFFELLRDYPRCFAVRLFTNNLPVDSSHGLGDYSEPHFPGYGPASIESWLEAYRSSDGRHTVLSTQARWRCTQNIAPVIIRGWFITNLYADGYLGVLAEFVAPEPVIISASGQTIIAPIQFKVFLVA